MSYKPFDITLRELIKLDTMRGFFSIACGKVPVKFLDPTLPTTIEKV